MIIESICIMVQKALFSFVFLAIQFFAVGFIIYPDQFCFWQFSCLVIDVIGAEELLMIASMLPYQAMILMFWFFQLGLIGILLIAIATDHCCTLIVKCKEIVIKKMCHRMVAEGYVDAHIEDQRKILGRTLSFGQMGKVTMGKLGTFLVDTSIVITQIGFCVGYFIFLGNTARSVVYEFLQYQHIGITNMNNSFPINFTNITTMIPMESLATTEHTTLLPLTTMRFASTGRSEATTMLEKAATLNSTGNQSYFVSANTSLQSFIMTTTLPLNMTYASKKNNTGFISNILSKIKNHLSTIKEKLVNAKLDNPITHRTLQENKAWTFSLLLVIPAPLLILISFIRNLRKLGPVSVLANGSITGAFLATAIYILVGEFNYFVIMQ